ncbi:dienelactone hydrolase [Pontibacter ummariensis]|uniref:Dienelactone hydrolase n=1 Tax=Pontibacter ummariensis TaxID=1610492 RepID=A0A239HN62_9BACT|nr:dienelactone hydrolase family protein [Pontibacter ummariensis]PRY10348.1 dienelactone hydrolase [Pontibacter ummariensis]SNS82787.1 Dienelactone hydrolase [Pontibacter ummariensis]
MANYNFNDSVRIDVQNVSLIGDLVIPEEAKGLVVFSHGSGSSRLSPRNRFVAEHLQRSGYATLLFDLLTPEEDEETKNRFDIPMLTKRLIDTTDWIQQDPRTADFNIAYFGASTGAASALGAAAALGNDIIKAVVSRGGRPDLADTALPDVQVPVLLIVGGKDESVLEMNIQANNKLLGIKDVEIVPDATHLFEEPGALEMCAQLATDWFRKYLPPKKQQPLRQNQP